jgi:hypothetical protein
MKCQQQQPNKSSTTVADHLELHRLLVGSKRMEWSQLPSLTFFNDG